MPPDLTDAQLRDLLTEGLSQREIARRTGIPRSSLQLRIKVLTLPVAPTPPTAPATNAPPAGQVPPTGQATPTPPTAPAPPAIPAAPAVTFVAVPEMQELLSLVKDLHSRVEVLEQTRVPPVLPAAPVSPTPPTAPMTPAPPAVERKDVQQWTIRLSKGLIDHIKAVAYERRMPPSQLIEELVWQALHDR